MNNSIKVIAEAGINHNGDFKKAIKLVKIAKMANADFVKFQLFKTENFINKEFSHSKINYKKVYKRFKSLEFSIQEWKKIIAYGNKIGIKVFSVFDFESLRTIKKLNIKLIKIASGEINNFSFFKKIKEQNLKVILSTGMSSLYEIKKTQLKDLIKKILLLMHCMSEYPSVHPNLKNIQHLKKFKIPVGYSDHTEDTLTPALSVLQAQI